MKTKIRRILLAEDEPDVAVAIEAVLEESGFFKVDRYYDAASEAVQTFEQHRFDK